MDNARYLSNSGRTRGLLSLLFFLHPVSSRFTRFSVFFVKLSFEFRDLRFAIDDRSVRGIFFADYFFLFYFRQFQKEEDRNVGYCSSDIVTSITNELDLLTEVERGDPICQRFCRSV